MLRPAARASAARFRSGWPLTQVHRDAEFVFGRPVRRRIIAGDQIDRQVREVIGSVVAQVDLQIVANGVQDFEQRVQVGERQRRAAVGQRPGKSRAPPLLDQFAQRGFFGVLRIVGGGDRAPGFDRAGPRGCLRCGFSNSWRIFAASAADCCGVRTGWHQS